MSLWHRWSSTLDLSGIPHDNVTSNTHWLLKEGNIVSEGVEKNGNFHVLYGIHGGLKTGQDVLCGMPQTVDYSVCSFSVGTRVTFAAERKDSARGNGASDYEDEGDNSVDGAGNDAVDGGDHSVDGGDHSVDDWGHSVDGGEDSVDDGDNSVYHWDK